MNTRGPALDEVNGSWVPSIVGNRELGGRRDGLRRVLVVVLIFRCTTRQTAGGGRGGKLESREDCWATDGGIEGGCVTRGVEDEGVGADDIAGGRAGVSTGLCFDRGAGVATSGEIAEELSVSGPGLSLSPAPEVTTTGDEKAEEDSHGQDGGDAGGDTGPV